jgi:enoyl-CoA hydratase/carnithine racemase
MSSPAAQTDLVLRHDSHGAIYLSLNLPNKLNTLSEAMLAALQSELDSIASDDSAMCVVISGQGKAFCAGHDLAEMRSKPDKAYYQDLFSRCGKVMQSIVNLPVPVIAKVHGIATAAGCQLAASCDLAIAAESARFGVSGINVGLFCSTPAVALSRNVSSKRAFDMLITGDMIDATTACDWGLASQVVADEMLDAAVEAKVAKILSKSPAAVRTGKAMFYRQKQMNLAEAYEYAGNMMAENMMAADAGEGIDAFLQKRPPVWQK